MIWKPMMMALMMWAWKAIIISPCDAGTNDASPESDDIISSEIQSKGHIVHSKDYARISPYDTSTYNTSPQSNDISPSATLIKDCIVHSKYSASYNNNNDNDMEPETYDDVDSYLT